MNLKLKAPFVITLAAAAATASMACEDDHSYVNPPPRNVSTNPPECARPPCDQEPIVAKPTVSGDASARDASEDAGITDAGDAG